MIYDGSYLAILLLASQIRVLSLKAQKKLGVKYKNHFTSSPVKSSNQFYLLSKWWKIQCPNSSVNINNYDANNNNGFFALLGAGIFSMAS